MPILAMRKWKLGDSQHGHKAGVSQSKNLYRSGPGSKLYGLSVFDTVTPGVRLTGSIAIFFMALFCLTYSFQKYQMPSILQALFWVFRIENASEDSR